MTKLEQAALQALKDWDKRNPLDEAMNLMEEALAEQTEQEPVAWMQDKNDLYVADQPDKFYTIPLYAAPVRTKDLTDDEIDAIDCEYELDDYGLRDFARAVIAADREKNK